MDETLTVKVRHEQNCAIMTITKKIDISTVTALRNCLFEVTSSGTPLMIDLEQISFINSIKLATLVGTAKRAEAHNSNLQITCALPKIRQLIHLTELDCRIPLARTLDKTLEFQTATSTNPPCQPAELHHA